MLPEVPECCPFSFTYPGLEESDSGVWKLFLAVSLHAVAISFCIGTEMSTTGLRKRSIIIYISVLR